MIFFTKKTLLGGLEILKKFKMRIAADLIFIVSSNQLTGQ
jgi:hypothetical protein